MKNKRISSMNKKTLVYLFVFTASILLLLWLFQIFYLKYSYRDYQLKVMNNLANSIKENKSNDLNNDLDKIAYQNEVCIEYHSYNNDIKYFNTRMIGCALNRKTPELTNIINNFKNSNQDIGTTELVNQEYEVKAFLYSIKVNDGYVFMYSTLDDVSRANVVLKNQLIYITIVAIILSWFISYFISIRVSAPIHDITKRARMLGSGDKVSFPNYDISEINDLAIVLDEAQKDILKNDELRRDLMANVSHDLKTPLTMIKAYAEMIRDISYKNEEKRNEHLKIIIDETDRLNILVNDILSLSKLQANASKIEYSDYDLVTEINKIINNYQIIKETEDYQFVLDMPSKVMVHADKKMINQVIYNLINNAINYTGKDKLVKIRISREKSNYLVEIIDTGKGIKKEELDYIWNKYYKNDKNHQRNIIGTGIGLSIVKSVLERHHFKYGVKSKINEGTNFYFYIKKK